MRRGDIPVELLKLLGVAQQRFGQKIEAAGQDLVAFISGGGKVAQQMRHVSEAGERFLDLDEVPQGGSR